MNFVSKVILHYALPDALTGHHAKGGLIMKHKPHRLLAYISYDIKQDTFWDDIRGMNKLAEAVYKTQLFVPLMPLPLFPWLVSFQPKKYEIKDQNDYRSLCKGLMLRCDCIVIQKGKEIKDDVDFAHKQELTMYDLDYIKKYITKD